MKYIIILFYLLTTTLETHFPRTHSMIHMTQSTYNKIIEKHSKIIILFYNSMCHSAHCRHVYHDFIDAALSEIRSCPSERSSLN